AANSCCSNRIGRLSWEIAFGDAGRESRHPEAAFAGQGADRVGRQRSLGVPFYTRSHLINSGIALKHARRAVDRLGQHWATRQKQSSSPPPGSIMLAESLPLECRPPSLAPHCQASRPYSAQGGRWRVHARESSARSVRPRPTCRRLLSEPG